MNQIRAGVVLNYVILALSTLTGLLYTPFMLRCLGQNEYGLYSIVASVIAYLTLLDFGFGSAIVRYAAKIRATGTNKDEWSLYGMFLSAYSVIGLFVTIGGIVVYLNTDRMFDRTMTPDELSQARIMMALMVGNLAFTFPLSIFGSIISAYERFVFQRVLGIARILLSTAVMIAVLSLGYKAIAMVIVQTLFSVCTLVANFLYCKYRLQVKLVFNNFNYQLLKEIMIFSFWNFLGAIVDRIYWNTGQFILGVYSGTAAVAVFSVAITLMTFYMSMSTSFNGVLLPRITKLSTMQDKDDEISDLFIKTGRLQFCVLSFMLSGFIVFGRPFVQLWAGAGYSESYLITLIFFSALLCPLIQNVGITILLARGQQKFRSLTYLAIAVASLIAQIVFTPKYGAIGCAWVIGITLFLGQWVVMNIYYHKRQHLNIPLFWRQIVGMAVMPLLIAFAGYLLVNQLDINTWSKIFLAILTFFLIYMPLFWRFSMNSYERSTILAPLKSLASIISKAR